MNCAVCGLPLPTEPYMDAHHGCQSTLDGWRARGFRPPDANKFFSRGIVSQIKPVTSNVAHVDLNRMGPIATALPDWHCGSPGCNVDHSATNPCAGSPQGKRAIVYPRAAIQELPPVLSQAEIDRHFAAQVPPVFAERIAARDALLRRALPILADLAHHPEVAKLCREIRDLDAPPADPMPPKASDVILGYAFGADVGRGRDVHVQWLDEGQHITVRSRNKGEDR